MSRAAGAEMLLNINASPFHIGKAPEREGLVQQRARENRLPIVYANLVGGQDELVFDGGSFVVDASGTLQQRLPFFEECSATLRIDTSKRPPLPVGQAVMVEMGELQRIYEALVLGVRDYVRKNGFNGAILGLSGGVDSALTLAIAVDALGADQVEVVMMPSRYTAEMSNQDAVAEAEALGVQYRSIPILKAAYVLPSLGPHRPLRLVGGVIGDLPEDLVVDLLCLAACQGQKGLPLVPGELLRGKQLADRGEQVDVGDHGVTYLPTVETARAADNEHDARAVIQKIALHAGEGNAMVSGADNQSVLPETTTVQRLKYRSHSLVQPSGARLESGHIQARFGPVRERMGR